MFCQHYRFNHKTAAEDVHFTSVSSNSESDDEAESGQTDEHIKTDDDDDEDDPNASLSPVNDPEPDIALSDEKSTDDSYVEHPLVWGDDPATLEMIMIKDVKIGNEVSSVRLHRLEMSIEVFVACNEFLSLGNSMILFIIKDRVSLVRGGFITFAANSGFFFWNCLERWTGEVVESKLIQTTQQDRQ